MGHHDRGEEAPQIVDKVDALFRTLRFLAADLLVGLPIFYGHLLVHIVDEWALERRVRGRVDILVLVGLFLAACEQHVAGGVAGHGALFPERQLSPYPLLHAVWYAEEEDHEEHEDEHLAVNPYCRREILPRLRGEQTVIVVRAVSARLRADGSDSGIVAITVVLRVFAREAHVFRCNILVEAPVRFDRVGDDEEAHAADQKACPDDQRRCPAATASLSLCRSH
mmetsp:Transcript_55656/g.153631  ORF Transcript_55656/g.153631 Transcript_55656/m.153631 type:complete len:224 (+) Transcript_55656:1362-2033(+)